MPGRARQRGAFLVLAAFLMAVLLGIVALGIDVGRLYALRSEMQNHRLPNREAETAKAHRG